MAPRSSLLLLGVVILAVLDLSFSQEAPGTCPTFPPPEECPDEPDNDCNDDSECAQLSGEGDVYKCCLDGCDKRCVPALPPPTPAKPRIGGPGEPGPKGEKVRK
ncbi:uncharacterized protein LOC110254709 [Exaiptasia diaphana]|uniref:WAP domain-containing protein n=1 Tax=Exaiptasia diaphana TaxID=2652724 RepID=A0A913YAQ2_EXADI|nr:uncharacterized protein LOC110254709 [Exaiptasia diaphana]